MSSKAGDQEIKGRYYFVAMFLEGTNLFPKSLYRNAGKLSR